MKVSVIADIVEERIYEIFKRQMEKRRSQYGHVNQQWLYMLQFPALEVLKNVYSNILYWMSLNVHVKDPPAFHTDPPRMSQGRSKYNDLCLILWSPEIHFWNSVVKKHLLKCRYQMTGLNIRREGEKGHIQIMFRVYYISTSTSFFLLLFLVSAAFSFIPSFLATFPQLCGRVFPSGPIPYVTFWHDVGLNFPAYA